VSSVTELNNISHSVAG